MGDPPLNHPMLQARLRPEILAQGRDLALQALLKVPDVGRATKSFTLIKQGRGEGYISFLDCLKEALEKQVENAEAREVLLLKLAFDNVNMDCKKVLLPLKNPLLTDMIEATQKVESMSHNMETLATAFATAMKVPQSCFSCGKTGHFKRDCPQLRKRDTTSSKQIWT